MKKRDIWTIVWIVVVVVGALMCPDLTWLIT